MNNNDINNIIDRMIIAYEVDNKKKLSKIMGYNGNSTISNWIKLNKIPYKKILQVANETNVNIEWLEYGTGDIRKEEPHSSNISANSQDDLFINLYSNIQDATSNVQTFAHLQETVKINKELLSTQESLKAIRIQGDSMQPRIFNGDIVVISYTKQDFINENSIYLVQIDNTLYIKLIRKTTNGYDLISYNKNYQPIEVLNKIIEKQNFKILGKLILNISRM